MAFAIFLSVQHASAGLAFSPGNVAAVPLAFEAMEAGAGNTRYLARGPGYTLVLSPDQALLSLKDPTETRRSARGRRYGRQRHEGLAARESLPAQPPAVLRVSLVAGNRNPVLQGQEIGQTLVNYFLGNDPKQWRTGLPTFGKVRYFDAYPGIDLVYYGNQRQVEFDFVVAANTDPSPIELALNGPDHLEVNQRGDLLIRIGERELQWQAPIASQSVRGKRREIACAFDLRSGGRVGFRIGQYDRNLPLIIDPVLVYSTFVGGSDQELAEAIAVDKKGDVYLTGQTLSADFPTTNAYQGSIAASSDVFVTKLNSNATRILYSTYLGGDGDEAALGLALDANGNALLTGYTDSSDFPTRNSVQSSLGGNLGYEDAFFLKLNTNGSALIYSTYFGGSDFDSGTAVAVDAIGNAVIVGETFSGNSFPKKSPFQNTPGGEGEAFVAKFNPGASGNSSLLFASWLGGPEDERAEAVAVDTSGNIYFTGEIYSFDYLTANLPTLKPLQSTYGGGGTDAFLAKVTSSGSSRLFVTYLGGTDQDAGLAIAVDTNQNVFVAGETSSANFPVTNAAQPMIAGSVFFTLDGFVTKVKNTGTNLLYSSFLGGMLDDSILGLALDLPGNIYVTGVTRSEDFPLGGNPFQGSYGGGGADAFVTMFNPLLSGPSSMPFSSCLGGSAADSGQGIAVDTNGTVYVLGQTLSTSDFPITPSVVRTNHTGIGEDVFVTKLIQNPALSTTRAGNNLTLAWPSWPPGFRLESASALPAAVWNAVPGTPSVSNGTNRLTVTLSSSKVFYRLKKNL